MSFTIPAHYWPLTALQIIRLVLAFPAHRQIRVMEIDWEAGTFRYVRS